MSDRWVTVYGGPIWEAQMVRDRLDDEGIESFLPDETTKVVDPFITGGNPLAVALQVRAPDAERAQALVATYHKAPPEGEEAHEVPDGEEDEEEDDGDDLDWLATRTRWASLLLITAPFAIVTGVLYLIACRDEKRRAPYHALTVTGFATSTMLLLWALYLLVQAIAQSA